MNNRRRPYPPKSSNNKPIKRMAPSSRIAPVMIPPSKGRVILGGRMTRGRFYPFKPFKSQSGIMWTIWTARKWKRRTIRIPRQRWMDRASSLRIRKALAQSRRMVQIRTLYVSSHSAGRAWVIMLTLRSLKVSTRASRRSPAATSAFLKTSHNPSSGKSRKWEAASAN